MHGAGYPSAVAGRRDIDRLHEELEELFAELWQGPRIAARRRGFRPHVDYLRIDSPPELKIVVDLAGVDPADVELSIVGQELVISGQRFRSALDPKCRPSYYQMEIEYGPFERRVRLPDGAAAKGAKATYERGLLTIALPIVEERSETGLISIPVTRQP